MSCIGFPQLCLLFLIAQSVICDWQPNNSEEEALCNTAECKTRGEQYKNNLNTKANPCQDFYTFSCGNWEKHHPGPKYAPEWTILQEIYVEFNGIIRKLLETYKHREGDDTSFLQAKIIYDTCLKIPEYPIKDASDIAREVKNVGHVSKTSIWDIHTKYLQLSGESALFRSAIMGAKQFGSTPLLLLLEPQSPYGLIFHEEVWKPQEKQAYIEFLFLIMKSLKLKDSDTVISQKIEKVFEFREKLYKIIRENNKRKPEPFHSYTGQELNDRFLQVYPHMTSTQKIPWTKVIDALLPSVPSEQRQTRKVIAMRQKQYFFNVMALLKETPEEIIANHMEMYFVERHMKLDEKMYTLLESTSIEPHGLLRYIRGKDSPRWQTCIENFNLKEVLEELLYHKWFQKDTPDKIRDMSSKIKLAIEDQMKKSSWLDESTREETTTRINNVEEWIGFPPWLYNKRATRMERNKNDILTPEAYLYTQLNRLYVHVPLLQPPLYNSTMPDLYNYAGLGTTLGHEFYHVINDCGAHPNAIGKLEPWWKPAMRAKCLVRKARFVDAYNKMTDMDFKNRYNVNLKSDTSISVLENYPDVMGLEAAFNAYKDLVKSDKSHCQTLPNFENYNCDQMFYIAFANTYCGARTKKGAQKKLGFAVHSLDSIRINGAVAQMSSFGTVFGCPVGSPMNPMEKVNLWH